MLDPAHESNLNPHVGSHDGPPAPLTEDELIEACERFADDYVAYECGVVEHSPITARRRPHAPTARRRPTKPRPHRRSRSRESHRARAGHRRTTSTRGGDGGDDDGPQDPAWPRILAAHVRLDLLAGQPRVVVLPDLAAYRRLADALDAAEVEFGAVLHANGDGALAVEFTSREAPS